MEMNKTGEKCGGEAGGGNWSVPSRPRELIPTQLSLFPQKEKYPTVKKVRWRKRLKKTEE